MCSQSILNFIIISKRRVLNKQYLILLAFGLFWFFCFCSNEKFKFIILRVIGQERLFV